MRTCAPIFALIVMLTLAGGQARAQSEEGYSAAGLYNLANSYARAGQPGMAVLNYERASLLAPNDPDIDANLRFVLASAKIPAMPRSGFDRAMRIASPQVVAWIGVIGLAMLGVSLTAGSFLSRFRWMRRSGIGVGLVLIVLTVANGVIVWPALHQGIVIKASTLVRVAPVPMGDSIFVLPEAETVTISAEHEGFLLIQTRAGRTGWVSRNSVAPIVPRNSSGNPM
jgi:hypothetical protein